MFGPATKYFTYYADLSQYQIAYYTRSSVLAYDYLCRLRSRRKERGATPTLTQAENTRFLDLFYQVNYGIRPSDIPF